mgnify:FL=1
MILEKLTILNYKNIGEVTLDFSPKVNCFIGHNGVGKTNVLDAIHYLSFCRSSISNADSQVIRHGEEFFMLEGRYATDEGEPEIVYCGMKRGTKKHFKRNGKEYRRLSEHIGLIPIVMVAPADNMIIDGQSEERRRLMDMVISQFDHAYIDHLSRYTKALQQRNSLLRQDEEPDASLLDVLEEQMGYEGECVFAAREAFVNELIPVFQRYYEAISGGREEVGISYESHCRRGPLCEVIRRDRFKDRAVGYSLHGVHRDDLLFTLGSHQMKREGSQGQNKTFAVALKLAQFDFLKRTASRTTPLLLLDDIFDKLDSDRVERIVEIVSASGFGQIFVTDTNRDHLDKILARSGGDYKIFEVKGDW